MLGMKTNDELDAIEAKTALLEAAHGGPTALTLGIRATAALARARNTPAGTARIEAFAKAQELRERADRAHEAEMGARGDDRGDA